MFWGWGLSWWNSAMSVALGVAAIAALAVFFCTRVVINLQDQETAALKRELSDAGERIETLKTLGDEARAQIVQGNIELEKERTERLKLAAKYAPRVITDEQARNLEKAMVPLAGQNVDVVSYESLGTDVAEFAMVLTANLNHDGLHAIQFTPSSGSGLVWGVVVRTEAGSPQAQVDALVKAFNDGGVQASSMDPYPVGQPIAGMFMGPTGVTPSAKLRVLIGAKPQQQ